ncbi:MAG: PAS domain S-box protein [Actinomycetia bacterium]|nr:PAS domain S-box protein [Actinomycetes bacterium]
MAETRPKEALRIEVLEQLFTSSEQWLVRRVLGYALELGYTKYTSTHEEAWLLSVRGLTDSLLQAARESGCDLDIRCEEDVSKDPATAFGIQEARQHRSRGIPFGMFLALMKYYAQSFQDLCGTLEDPADAHACSLLVARFFDRVEIGFSTEWAGLSEQAAVAELQDRNRMTTDEKVRYLTIFEGLNIPVVLLSEDGMLSNINEAAARAFGLTAVSGSAYYSHVAVGRPFEPLDDDVRAFLAAGRAEREFECKLETVAGPRFYVVRLKRMQDVSGTFHGVTVALHDVTDRKRIEDEVLESRAQYQALFENTVDAFAQHVAVRDETGAIVDYVFAEVNTAFEALFGLRSEDVIGRAVSEVWPPGNALCLN